MLVPYRLYISFSTVANPTVKGEDTYSKYSASQSVPPLKKLKQKDLGEYRGCYFDTHGRPRS